MSGIKINAPLITNGPIYANGPVFVQGVDVKKALDELNERLLKIEKQDLKIIKDNIDKLLKEFPVAEKTKTYLEKIREWIELGKDVKEIVQFIQQVWVYLGPIVTQILLGKP